MKTGTWAIIQARTGSTRLPGKVFLKLKGKPLIWHVVERLKGSREIDGILLATTENPNDQKLETWAVENNVSVFRGSEADVLSRYYHAAQTVDAGTIVRITADDPFKDRQVMDRIIRFYREQQLDFAYNNNPATYPEGLDVEVFSFEALEKAQLESKEPFEREHVTQYFYRRPQQFKQANYTHDSNLSHLRWTIDTEEDLEMARQVYDRLYAVGKTFLMQDILELLEIEPHIAEINTNAKRSHMYTQHNK